EEFAVLLADVDGVEARRIAARLLDAIRSVEVPLGPGDETYCGSASLGVALVTPDGTGLEAALAAADRAMYRAKQNGRNRVEMA
ncbi:MAG TPA: transcriptional regulator, partial [Tistrella mobilis]|nr:transcriptional regulator [Tistrella mobilis]